MKYLPAAVMLVCVVAVTVGALVCLHDAHLAIQHADKFILQADLVSLTSKMQAAVAKLDAAEERDSAYYDAAAKELPKTGKAIRALVEYTNKSLNQPSAGTLPRFNEAIAQFSLDSHNSLARFDEVAIAANSTLDSGTHDLDALGARLSDHRIDDLLGHLDMTSLHLEAATGHVSDTTAHLDHTVAYYDKRLTTPKGFVKTVGQGLWQLVVPATNVAIAVK